LIDPPVKDMRFALNRVEKRILLCAGAAAGFSRNQHAASGDH
jgi:hypothetical protein